METMNQRRLPILLSARFVVALALAVGFVAVTGEALPLPPTVERIAIGVCYALLLLMAVLYGISWLKGRGTLSRPW
jgi:hypothetical protein